MAFVLLHSTLCAESSSARPLSFPYAPSPPLHTHWVSFSSSTLDPLLLTGLAQFRHGKKTSNILLPRLESLFPFSLPILLFSLLLSNLPLLFIFSLLLQDETGRGVPRPGAPWYLLMIRMGFHKWMLFFLKPGSQSSYLSEIWLGWKLEMPD